MALKDGAMEELGVLWEKGDEVLVRGVLEALIVIGASAGVGGDHYTLTNTLYYRRSSNNTVPTTLSPRRHLALPQRQRYM